MSMAPPPATTAELLSARRTIMMASCRERSASSMNWSLPPRSTMVAVRALGQPVNRLYLSAPTCGTGWVFLGLLQITMPMFLGLLQMTMPMSHHQCASEPA